MKKVLLINPPETEQTGFSCPPLGLLYIAGLLRQEGFDVQVLDGFMHGWKGVEARLRRFRPDITGITCLTPGRQKAVAVARLAKELNPQTQVVLGGAHPTIMYEQMLAAYPCIDVVVRGEGEMSFLDLARGADLDRIGGIAYREGERVARTGYRKGISDLDSLPFPAWDMVADTLDRYPRSASIESHQGIDLVGAPRISVVYSRGCVGRCEFCSTWWIWSGWRHRSARDMVDEIEFLTESLGVHHFWFADDALTVDRMATLDLCAEILRRKLKIAFFATTRPDCVDAEVLDAMRDAGCYEISYGIESASPKLLKKMKKNSDVETAERTIRATRDAGIRACALLIVGNVGETEETIDETVEFLEKTEPEGLGTVGGLWILPGTGLYRHAKKLGVIDDSFWLGEEPYKVFTEEHSFAELQLFTHAVKTRQRLSGMGFCARARFYARYWLDRAAARGGEFLSGVPALRAVVCAVYRGFRRVFDVSWGERGDS